MSTANDTQTRRRFVAMLPGLLASVAGMAGVARAMDDGRHGCAPRGHAAGGARHAARRAARHAAGPEHPEPRPGIDASRVLGRAQLEPGTDAAPVFDMVRQIPQIADGIRCHCGCPDAPGFRSLLSCYEGDGMAQHCVICQGQGKLAFRLFKEGKSLNAIRAAIDEEFG